MPKFNTRFMHTKNPVVEFNTPSRTQQQFGYEVDINNIVKGLVPINQIKQPLYNMSFSPDDYENSVNIIAEAKSKFEELPSSIRNEFDNDPKKLLAFVQDDKNYDRAVELGLIEKKPVQLPDPITTSQPAITVNPVPTQGVETGSTQT